jgi:hypothetical protein
MSNVFTTSFSFGPLFICVGLFCLTITAYLAARHFKAVLLYIAALGFLVCTFSGAASMAMPVQFEGNIWPPQWVSWLALVGSPVALLVAGVAALTFLVLHGRTRA